MDTHLQKLTTIALFFLFFLPSLFATEISLPGYNLPGNYQYYSVFFDEEGEAAVTIKLVLHLPPPQLVLEIPGNVQLSAVFQEIAPNERRWDAKYQPLMWDQQLSTYRITLADPFQEEVTLLLSYKTSNYVQKELGNFNFIFPTIKMASAVDSVRVAITVQPGLHLKDKESKVQYLEGSEAQYQLEQFSKFSMVKNFAAAEMSAISKRVMYAQGMVNEAFSLDSFENFTVAGVYGKSKAWLYRWEIIGGFGGFLTVMLILLGILKKVKKLDNQKIEIAVWSSSSALFSLAVLAGTFWMMDNLRYWVGYRLDGFFAMILVFSTGITILALLILPPVYLGKKYRYTTGLLTAALTVLWMLATSFLLIFFF
ncbi:hypothetical protein HYX13_00230 [Candidatus Woesearchaeota archaeon]|nr:hypothetical protein [Candidatus Woesearchaeota archaeon]